MIHTADGLQRRCGVVRADQFTTGLGHGDQDAGGFRHIGQGNAFIVAFLNDLVANVFRQRPGADQEILYRVFLALDLDSGRSMLLARLTMTSLA